MTEQKEALGLVLVLTFAVSPKHMSTENKVKF